MQLPAHQDTPRKWTTRCPTPRQLTITYNIIVLLYFALGILRNSRLLGGRTDTWPLSVARSLRAGSSEPHSSITHLSLKWRMSTLSWYVWLPTSVLEGALGLTATSLCQAGPASPKRLPFTVQATNVSSPKPKKLPKTPKSSSRRRILTPSLCSASPSGRSEPAAELKQTIESLRRERDEATATGCRLREANKLLVTRLKEVTSSDKSAPTATQPSPARLPAGGFLRFHSWCPPLQCDSGVAYCRVAFSPKQQEDENA